ncbi:alpha/beta fold hydrolase [Rhodococcus sp. NM-2]|jgi:pimeloyl-ACP methyl ester carboxylesterase|uniref:alpha/beta fold hydrolase n=1 Tax=Rhodococcus sp. NM-2 TaxID=3401174 RepID=UPI003AABB393
MTQTNESHDSTGTHIILAPGFWLGAWAWEAVASDLIRRGHHVTAVTLPGLHSSDSDRAGIRLDDHISAIADVVANTPSSERVVLVAHSGAGPVAYAASDRVPGRLARIVYVDSGPLQNGTALREDLDASVTEIPLPSWSELEADGSSLDGLDDAILETFRSRAVPEPAGPARDRLELRDSSRLDVPTTVICTSFPSEVIQQMAGAGHPMAAELAQIAKVDYVDLPTGHWPMWSRPADLATAIDTAARD